MDVETPDYKGKCRRGGGKLKLTFSDWRWLICIAFGITVAFVRMEMTSQANSETIKTHLKESREDKIPTRVATVEEKIGSIKEDVGEIKTEQKVIVQDIKTINKTVSDGFQEVLKLLK